MKNLSIIFCLFFVLISCLDSGEDFSSFNPELKDSLIVFNQINLKADSANIEIKWGAKKTIPLENDSLGIEVLRVSRTCYLGETSCDVPSDVTLRITYNKINYTLPLIDLGLGYGYKKFQVPTPSCSVKGAGLGYLVFKKFVFVVKEVAPYPSSRAEQISFFNQKLYTVKLTILKICP